MPSLDQLPAGTRIEFRGFDNWKGYASAMGFNIDSQPARRPGLCCMRRDVGVVADIKPPPFFTYEVVG